LLSLFLVSALILTFNTAPTEAQTEATLSISPPKIFGPPPNIGDSFKVNITVENYNMTSKGDTVGMSLVWDPSVLNVTSYSKITVGPWFVGYPTGYMTIPGDVGPGWADLPSISVDTAAGNVGSGVLFTVEFRVVGYGSTGINFSIPSLVHDRKEVPLILNDGYFELKPFRCPTAKFTYSPPSPIVNGTITFDASGSLPGYNGTHNIRIANYTWDFGDGNVTVVETSTIKHKYIAAGVYTVNLTVTCEYNSVLAGLGLLSNSTWQEITVRPPLPYSPTAIKTHTPSLYPRVNETITFDASASLPGWNGTHFIPIANYTWDFGDGNVTTITDPVINHTYLEADVYVVNLTVTCEYDSVLAGLGLLSNSTWQEITIYMLRYWYWKSNYTDYAPCGVPDFDQRQGNWRNPYPPMGAWSWCGPAAVADSLWWMDSRFEVINVPPPSISDSFPLVQAYGSWDDHDPRNVRPLVEKLAWYMDTDGTRTGSPHCGTEIYDMESGINWYITDKGLDTVLYVDTLKAPSFREVQCEVERSEDVILLLGFWQWNGTSWIRVAGHYVAVAGLNPGDMQIAICDPILDAAELGGAGRVFPEPHRQGHTFATHNNASYASQDIYAVGSSTSPGGAWELIDYPAYMIIYDVGENLPNDLKPYAGEFDYALPIFTVVEYAVTVSPKGPIFHDVAVTDITPSAFEVYPTWIVPLKINVTVKNVGNLTETFNVILCWNNTNVIGTKTVTLNPQETKAVTYTWAIPTAPVTYPYPKYVLSANATLASDNNLNDNSLSDGAVTVKHPGDTDGDGKVYTLDLRSLVLAYREGISRPYEHPECDFDGDGRVYTTDLGILVLNYRWGVTWT
jgi:PKD repeat protein